MDENTNLIQKTKTVAEFAITAYVAVLCVQGLYALGHGTKLAISDKIKNRKNK